MSQVFGGPRNEAERLAERIMVVCPECKGAGKLMARIQYTDLRKPCRDELRDCIVCLGAGKVTAAADAAYARKYGR